MTEINFNPALSGESCQKVSQESLDGGKQMASGTLKILGSVWDTTTEVVGAVGDGVVGIAEGVFDVGVGAVKYTAAAIKAPFATVEDRISAVREKIGESGEEKSPEPSDTETVKDILKGVILEPAKDALAGKKPDKTFHEPAPKPTPTPDPTPEIPTPCDTVISDPDKLVIK